MKLTAVLGASLLALTAGDGCQPLNCPYPAGDAGKNVYYTTYTEDPRDLDPGISYNENEYIFLGQIYEPPLQYHYLKRPYALEPLTLAGMPRPTSLAKDGSVLPPEAPAEQVDRVVYECRLKPGIRYQDHPCFAVDSAGKPLYDPVDPALAARCDSPEDFPRKGTRELVASDYVRAIKRMASPLVACPIRETLAKYILGMEEYTAALEKDLQAERAGRKTASGASYNQALDEKARPIVLDLDSRAFPGVETVDRYAFRLTLKVKYPQILYWMAMPFFAPVPLEAEAFYRQPALVDRNITLHRFPVGTGAFYLQRFDANRRIVLARNPNFREERYSAEGEPEDAARGLLADAGKPMPFIDQAVFTLEKEPTPAWNKFLQGYYDLSGIPTDSFEQAVSISPQGSPEVAGELSEKRIALHKEVETSVFYLGFNMKDPVVGGYDEKHCKLRQAIDIAIDTEEDIQIFRNGRGIAAQSPIPIGIYGHEEGAGAINPFTFAWDPQAGAPRRRPLEEARKLLAEAGYPDGIGPDGKQLVIGFDNAMVRSSDQQSLNWLVRQFAKLGIHLESRTTDYNRFQEKMLAGNFQTFQWGWNADYPDPENFLFLFYGPNAKSESHGENAANYTNPEFDALFRKVENMENGSERLELIRKMVRILQHDAPWVNALYTVRYVLRHPWVRDYKPNLMAHNTLMHYRVDLPLRDAMRRDWNRPDWTPVLACFAVLLGLAVPAWWTARRRKSRKEQLV